MTTRFVGCVAAAALVLGCYTPKGAFVPVDDFAQPAATEYVLAPGDAISVRVFQQDAMSARVKVRADGVVTLPLVNDVAAAGKTPTALARELEGKLKDFINTPVVTIFVEESRPMTVSVLGEVGRPGVVTLEAGAGVLNALAAAGGLTDFAHKDGIFVLRKTGQEPGGKRIRFTWDALSRGEGKAARFTLQAQDTLVVE